jgi:hypothetical protein
MMPNLFKNNFIQFLILVGSVDDLSQQLHARTWRFRKAMIDGL